ncbi:MAG: hypothetical protein IJQ50_01580 [Clostridia bacterium]|nr:hypothetical protein [Clostridia bacterium]
MKKIYAILFVLFMVINVAGCSNQTENAQNVQDSESLADTNQSSENLKPIYAKDIKNGIYEISVDSSSSMFKVVKCELVVEDENMRAVMTMSGQGYGMVYMGTADEALADSEESYIPFILNENGEKTFTVPVEALNMETNCAAWSIKKSLWYDRVLIFKSEEIPKDAFIVE